MADCGISYVLGFREDCNGNDPTGWFSSEFLPRDNGQRKWVQGKAELGGTVERLI